MGIESPTVRADDRPQVAPLYKQYAYDTELSVHWLLTLFLSKDKFQMHFKGHAIILTTIYWPGGSTRLGQLLGHVDQEIQLVNQAGQ